MPLVSFLIICIIVGVALWLINTYVPMADPVKTVMNIVVVLVLVLWVLSLFGIGDLTIGRHVAR